MVKPYRTSGRIGDRLAHLVYWTDPKDATEEAFMLGFAFAAGLVRRHEDEREARSKASHAG